MLNTKETLYALDDVCIIPAAVSDIRSRSECDPYHVNKKLPIFTAPMTAVVSEENLNVWNKNDIIPILPRNIDIAKRIQYATTGTWAAFSISEFQKYFVDDIKELKPTGPIRVLIDIANGHMKCLLQMIPESKVAMRLNYGNDVDYEIMAGNVANPETYRNLSLVGCDYVRCSIGSGNCCFVNGTQITLADGTKKNIEDIQIGDIVLSAQGNECKIINTIHFLSNEDLIKINDITCTIDHEFLVINKSDKDKITEENLMTYAFYLHANKLNPDMHLIIERL